ncbi:MAG: SRPBCC family protein [Nocardioidaceae bacterium]|nr:SRPBCC family protein [Nocardioidaceae bacterium]
MELSHRFTVPTSIEVAWEAFNDLERVAPCFPGASLTSYDGDTFEGICKVKLGPVSLQYSGTGRFVERDESAYRAVIEAKGKDKRGNGTAAATITAQLASSGDAATDVIVSTDLNITGRPAQFGRGVMQDVSDKLLAQFATCLETKLAERNDGRTGAEAGAGAATGDGAAGDGSGAAGVDGGGSADETVAEPAGGEAPPLDGPLADGLVGLPDRHGARGGEGAKPSIDTTSSGLNESRAGKPETSTLDAPPESPELSLAGIVLPALLKRYAPYVVGGAVAVWLLRKHLHR